MRIVRLFGRRAVEASYPFYPLRHPLRPDRVLLWEHALQRPACARVPRSRAILTLSSNSDFACLYVIDPMGDQRALVGGGVVGGKGVLLVMGVSFCWAIVQPSGGWGGERAQR